MLCSIPIDLFVENPHYQQMLRENAARLRLIDPRHPALVEVGRNSLAKGEYYSKRGETTKAIDNYLMSLEVDPDNLRSSIFLLALKLIKSGELDET